MNPELPTRSDAFFRAWQVYRTIIEHDLMHHRALIDALREWAGPRPPFTALLDLGCGDAHVPRYAFSNFRGVYHGVDSSVEALSFAKTMIHGWTTELHLADLNTTLMNWDAPIDAVVSGYMFHHFTDERKAEALKEISQALPTGGYFIFYDLMCREGECREGCVDRAVALIDSWTDLSPDQRKMTQQHVLDCDFPVSESQWRQYGEHAGLKAGDTLYRDPADLFALMIFRKTC